MGCSQLLPYLETIRKRIILLTHFKEKCIGVDISVWCHQFGSLCARPVVAHRNYEKLGKMMSQRI